MVKPAWFVFHLLCLYSADTAPPTNLTSPPRRRPAFLWARVGDTVTLPCVYDNEVVARFYWYKQAPGQQPDLVVTFFKFKTTGAFHGEFEGDPRLSLETGLGTTRLRIRQAHASDSATYYCVSSFSAEYRFMEGINVIVNDSDVHAPTCRVHPGACGGEHIVFWFQNSQDSQPGLIYTDGDGKSQCERKPNTHTCYINLPVNDSYDCAVASCGHILFGLNSAWSSGQLDFSVTEYVLSGGVMFNILLCVLLGFCLCFINMRGSCHCTDSSVARSGSSTIQTKTLHMRDSACGPASVSGKINGVRQRRDDTWTECVYFTMRQ